MGSGIVFEGYDHDGSNGLIEHVLDLCIAEFEHVEGAADKPALKTFFDDYREKFFSGYYVFLDEDAIANASDAEFLARLFERVFQVALADDSPLTDYGRRTVQHDLAPLVGRLRQFAAGTLPPAPKRG